MPLKPIDCEDRPRLYIEPGSRLRLNRNDGHGSRSYCEGEFAVLNLHCCRLRHDCIRRCKGVDTVDCGSCQRLSTGRLRRYAGRICIDGDWIFRVKVGDFKQQLSIRGFCGDGINAWQGYAALRECACVHADRDECGVLKWNVHFEHIVGGRQDQFLLICEDHCLENVDHLGDVGHADSIGMTSEDVQVERGEYGV